MLPFFEEAFLKFPTVHHITFFTGTTSCKDGQEIETLLFQMVIEPVNSLNSFAKKEWKLDIGKLVIPASWVWYLLC